MTPPNLGAVKYERTISVDDNSSVAKLLRWIKPNSKILECGPATGIMTKILKNELFCHVTAIEIDAEAAEIARPYCDKIIVANLETVDLDKELGNARFDYIIFADVLEHLVEPLETLIRIRSFLKPRGEILISIPNVSHAAILGELIQGKFDYQKDGLLDNTHLRFFTRKSLKDLCSQAEFSIIEWERTVRSPEQTEFAVSYQNLPNSIKSLFSSYADYDTYQFLLRISRGASLQTANIPPNAANSEFNIIRCATIYFSQNTTFSENNSDRQIINSENQISTVLFSIPAGTKSLRLDAIDSMEPYVLKTIELKDPAGNILWKWDSNNKKNENSYLLLNISEIQIPGTTVHIPTNIDPQIYINLDRPLSTNSSLELKISYNISPFLLELRQLASSPIEILNSLKDELIAVSKLAEALKEEAIRGWAAHNILEKNLRDALTENNNLKVALTENKNLADSLSAATSQNSLLTEERHRLLDRIHHLQHLLDLIWTSRSWKMTKPVRAIGLLARSIRGIFRKTKILLINRLKKHSYKNYMLFKFMAKQGYFTETEKYAVWTGFQPKADLNIKFSYSPKISVILPVYKTPLKWLQECIESVLRQSYTNWELCIADDCSDDPGIRSILSTYENSDPRIKVIHRQQNGHIAESSQSALDIASGEFISLLDHDDLLYKDALYWVVNELNRNPDLDFIYSNEDKLNLNGQFDQPAFKPGWSPEYFLSFMYTGHLATYRTELARKVGGFRKGTDGSQDYDLTLRITANTSKVAHIPKILYHWREHADSIALNLHCKDYAFKAAKQSLTGHLQKVCNKETEVYDSKFKGIYRFRCKNPDSFKEVLFDCDIPLNSFKSLILNSANQTDSDIILFSRSDAKKGENLCTSLCSALSIKELAAVSPILVHDNKVLVCGYSIYNNQITPLLRGIALDSAGLGARLAAMHNASLITLDYFAIKRSILVDSKNAIENAKSFSEVALVISQKIKESGYRIAVIPENVELPTSKTIYTEGRANRYFKEDNFIPRNINFKDNSLTYI